jgi:hypothetical protein
MVRERLERMGLSVTEAAARSLVEALLAFEGPRMYAQAQSNLENSLEIIRDTAESALAALQDERSAPTPTVPSIPAAPLPAVPPVTAATIDERPPVPRRPPELLDELDEDDEPRPVFKRPRR